MLAAPNDVMSASWQAAFFTGAVVLFLLAGVQDLVARVKTKLNFIALGLALFVFVFAWNAWAAT